jgi:NAD(P)-dependent dehydrogenase (short-subunit alcohol dehydrogenase family)
LTKPESIGKAVDDAVAAFGRLDILITNAAVFGKLVTHLNELIKCAYGTKRTKLHRLIGSGHWSLPHRKKRHDDTYQPFDSTTTPSASDGGGGVVACAFAPR